MPKRPSNRYDSDDGDGDGFIAASGDEDRGPKSKRMKTERGKKGVKKENVKPVGKKDAERGKKEVGKKGKGEGIVGGGGRDRNGDEFWELSDKRRLTISTFNKQLMVNIREYYEKDGEMLPAKKGISLPIPQFSAVIALLPHIESIIRAKGQTLVRPEYSKSKSTAKRGGGDDDDDEEDEEEDGGGGDRGGEDSDGNSEGDAGKGFGKKNFEATSDEEG